jgi:hypothetical protein
LDSRILGLSIALAYPQYAFAGTPSVVSESEDLVRRAGRGEAVALEVAALLRLHPELNEWIEQVLEDRDLTPPHLRRRRVRSYSQLLGDGSPVSMGRYTCPAGDRFTWHRASVADVVPPCGICGRPLSRA